MTGTASNLLVQLKFRRAMVAAQIRLDPGCANAPHACIPIGQQCVDRPATR
jgi:hypothetical protein